MKLLFEDAAYEKMFLYAEACATEVTGLGIAKVRGQSIHVLDTFIIPQYATGSYVEAHGEALSQWMADRKNHHLIKDVKFWWHSHVNMAVFMSGTDDDTAMRMAATMPFLATAVVNKKRECYARLYSNKPIRFYGEVDYSTVSRHSTRNLREKCIAEAKDLVVPMPEEVDPLEASPPTPIRVVEASAFDDLWDKYNEERSAGKSLHTVPDSYFTKEHDRA